MLFCKDFKEQSTSRAAVLKVLLTPTAGMSNIWPAGQNRPVERLNLAPWMIL